jgi:transcriptional regulator with AAA-type ATPase domain
MTEPEIDTFEDSPGSHPAAITPGRPHLFVVLECDRPTSGGARYALEEMQEVVVGRGSERSGTRATEGGVNRLMVRIPGRSMSATHARLLRVDGEWVLEDARSTNGSYVNGTRVERALLRDGDVVELGHTLFVLRLAMSTPAGCATDLDTLRHESAPVGFSTLLPQEQPRLEALTRIARSDISILLLGETGSGKEVIARSLHRISGRPGPFLALNCGALPTNLVESHLFGHVRGAFSGAVKDELGAVRSADRGTLLLDEIGDLPPAAQPAFLRFLQERDVTPVGSAQPCQVDTRVIAATHQPVQDLVARSTFRSDLLARLTGYTHLLRPLRDRREDLGVIIAGILAANRALTTADVFIAPNVGAHWLSHPWPCNIRQLEQTLLRALVLADGNAIQLRHLLHGEVATTGSNYPSDRKAPHIPQRLSEEETNLRAALVRYLQEHNGNISDVARAMGKARMQIHRWMRRWEIEPGTFRRQSGESNRESQ